MLQWIASPHEENLLGLCSGNHNETLVYIYFVERWTEEIARRDPLHDQYVILYFSGEGKFTRTFSNVADISSHLPTIHGVLAAIDVERRHQGTII